MFRVVMTYEDYLIREEINNPHSEFFTKIKDNEYYVECDYIFCDFREGPFTNEYTADIAGRAHVEESLNYDYSLESST
jgi:hypothetical protein